MTGRAPGSTPPFCHVCPTEQPGRWGAVIKTGFSQTGAPASPRRPEHQQPKSTDEESAPTDERRGCHSYFKRPTECSDFKIFTSLKVLDIWFCSKEIEIHPKPQQPYLYPKQRYIILIVLNEGGESVTLCKQQKIKIPKSAICGAAESTVCCGSSNT